MRLSKKKVNQDEETLEIEESMNTASAEEVETNFEQLDFTESNQDFTTDTNIEEAEQVDLTKQLNEDEASQSEAEVNTAPKDTRLYVLSDRAINFELEYYRQCGLNVVNVFHKVEDVLAIMMFEMRNIRVAIIDSGKGEFTSSAGRDELIDVLGSAGENVKFTVFFTDSAVKEEAKRKLGEIYKSISWIKFNTTQIAIATILSGYNENYILDDSEKVIEADEAENYDLKFKGDKQFLNKEAEGPAYMEIINPQSIYNEMLAESTESDLPTYSTKKEEPKIKKLKA